MSLKIEQILINKILSGEISFDFILERDFEARSLKDLREPYEYLYNHWLEKKSLPDKDLLITRYNYLDLELNAEIPANEIIDSISEGAKKGNLYADLQKSIQLYTKNDRVEPVIEFLKSQLPKYEKKIESKDVYDLTNPKDLEELNNLQDYKGKIRGKDDEI